MTTLDISLCLPELDIIALAQKRSIVVVTKRFIVPDRSFVLLPCRADSTAYESYHPQVLSDLKDFAAHSSKPISAEYWAQCVFCQQVDEGAVATLSNFTIWTAEALFQQLKNGSLFLSLLRTYALPATFALDAEPVCEQIYKFVPMPHYLEAKTDLPVYSDDEFAVAKQAILDPKRAELERADVDTSSEENIEPAKSILDSPDWIEQISKVGNSSNGHDFEKLVRKGLVFLGFSNSLNQAMASLDPDATGGAGGIDFYADEPYSIVGECKASADDKVGTPVKQLHKLGIQWLGLEGYNRSTKLVIAGGSTTRQDEQFAKSSETNVISPEAFQSLLLLKEQHQQFFTLSSLKATLDSPPFGKAADKKLLASILAWRNSFEEQEAAALEHAQYRQQASQIVQTVKELSQQSIHKERKGFLVVEVRSHYNAKHQPCLADEEIKNALLALSSPFSAGCIEKYQATGGQDVYVFKKDMRLPSL